MSHARRRSIATLCLAALTAAVLSAAGTPAGNERTNLGHGVSKDSIKVGFAIVDFESIANFVDYERGDQEETARVLIDAINKDGGINGRKIVPFFKTYPPIPGRQPSPLSLCTSWTEDDGVFAVLGSFVDPTGQGPLCLAKEHETIHIGHQLNQAWIDEAPPGLLLTPDSTRENNAKVLVDLVVKNNLLKGKKVGLLTDQAGADRATQTVLPLLREHRVKTGSTAVLTITGTDTTAAQSQLDSFIEKWKGEGVDAVLMVGANVTAKQFAEPIRAAMPNAMLLSDSAANALPQARDEVAAGKDPNPYEGLVGVFGLTEPERWDHKTRVYRDCIDTYQKATGRKVPGPESTQRTASGKRVDLYASISDFCSELHIFTEVARKAGPRLTIANWQKAVDHLGPIQLAQTAIASLCKGKYAATDGRRLVQFDSTEGTEGDWKTLTPLEDASGGQCTKEPGGS